MILVPGQDDNVTGTRPRVGHVSHSVVLGTFCVGEQDEGGSPDVNQVLYSAKLFSIKWFSVHCGDWGSS
ncbi:hypothetical protein Hdeb2414_s0001g00025871 [Helianthus debilis subsp. tardiflorus]